MAKDPAFLFYSADFMMGTMLLTMEERGQFITLLSVMHQQGRLSADEVEVVIKGKPSQKLASKFKIDEKGLWFNERLEAESDKRKKFTESRKNSLSIHNNDQVHIYILMDPMSGYFKIGSSKYPGLRLTEMQKKNPAVEMIWKSEELVVRSIEKSLHDEFKEKRIKNDWFSLTEQDLNSIASREIFRTNTKEGTRTDSRTVNVNVNGNTNANGFNHQLKESDKKLESIETRFLEIFDELYLDRDVRPAFRDIDLNDQLLKFKAKVRGSPGDYQISDTGRMRNAFLYQLRQEKPKKNKQAIKKFTIDELNQK